MVVRMGILRYIGKIHQHPCPTHLGQVKTWMKRFSKRTYFFLEWKTWRIKFIILNESRSHSGLGKGKYNLNLGASLW